MAEADIASALSTVTLDELKDQTGAQSAGAELFNHLRVLWTEEREWGVTVPVDEFIDALLDKAESACKDFAADKNLDVHNYMMAGFREHLHAILCEETGVVAVGVLNDLSRSTSRPSRMR
ncbi:hypothetical protein H9P43_005597 [Blastocladiella emersonii ATCC 22665]|nr:hypothetical protein H9P43_005597 [Blastocladiella emersonii ATCC 22665]